MECLIIRLSEEETSSWRKGDPESEALKEECCKLARRLSKQMLVAVEIETLPEDNPDYLEARPTTLWSSNER